MQDYQTQTAIKAEIQSAINEVADKIELIDWNPIVKKRALVRLSDVAFQVNKA